MGSPSNSSYLSDFLVKFSGEDYRIVNKEETDNRAKLSFRNIGLFVLLIYIFTTLSGIYYIHVLFDLYVVLAIIIGLFWGLLIANLYLLLLYSITPKLIDSSERKIKGKVQYQAIANNKFGIGISLLVRVLFISFLALFIVQSFNVLLFDSLVEEELDRHKMAIINKSFLATEISALDEERKEFENLFFSSSDSSDAFVQRELNRKLLVDSIFVKNMSFQMNKTKVDSLTETARDSIQQIVTLLTTNQTLSNKTFLTSFSNYQSTLRLEPFIRIIENKNSVAQGVIKSVNANNFFTKKIKLLYTKVPLVYLSTLIAAILFVLPIYIKFFIRLKSNFYDIKAAVETSFIKERYNSFKNELTIIFRENHNLDVTFYEAYIDPPFNLTKKIHANKLGSQDLLLSQIYVGKIEEEGTLVDEYFTDPEEA